MIKQLTTDDSLDTSVTSTSMTSSEEGAGKRDSEYDFYSSDNLDPEDDASLCEDSGVLFEGSLPTTSKHYSWKQKTNTSESSTSTRRPIQVAVSCVDDEPGAVQSGHYQWPAAEKLCEYLVQSCEEHQNASERSASSADTTTTNVRGILELGAGTALTSLCALQVYQKSLEFVVVTDHDPGTIERARDNYETTMMELHESAESEEAKEAVINEISSILVEFAPLKWGKENQFKDLQQRVVQDHAVLEKEPPITFDLVLGSDLIYSLDVVEPLLKTVKLALKKPDDNETKSRFLLAQSFSFDDEVEAEIERVCQTLRLQRKIVEDNLSEGSGARIQEFSHLSKEEA